jgi:hypothetical protein
MKPEELDRVLAGEEAIEPSSGFVGAVMDAVTSAAHTPPPLAFPWRRAWPLAVVSCALLVWLVWAAAGADPAIAEPDPYAWFRRIVPMETRWVASGLLLTAALTVWSLVQAMRRVRV